MRPTSLGFGDSSSSTAKRHSETLAAPEIGALLSSLAEADVSSSTQNQALAAPCCFSTSKSWGANLRGCETGPCQTALSTADLHRPRSVFFSSYPACRRRDSQSGQNRGVPWMAR